MLELCLYFMMVFIRTYWRAWLRDSLPSKWSELCYCNY